MTTLELKTAIKQAVDKAPEDFLQEIYDFINSAQEKAHDDKMYRLIDKIIEEESNVLKRLAE